MINSMSIYLESNNTTATLYFEPESIQKTTTTISHPQNPIIQMTARIRVYVDVAPTGNSIHNEKSSQ